jgi:ubiquinone/menaquinone biosynthesis C-methylase UbiE
MSEKPFNKKTVRSVPQKTSKETSWGGVSAWYDELVESDDSYQTQVIAPNLLRLLGNIKGKNVLDLASGQGFFSRLMSAGGATVTGVDISSELVLYAKKKGGENIDYKVSPAHKLPFIKDHSMDVVVCVLAFQNIENLSDVVKEISRVITPAGRLYLVLNHPAFRIPQNADWGVDEGKNLQYRREDIYLSEKTISIAMHPGKQDSLTTVSFHRSLQYFFKLFNKNNFAVTRLEEWISHKQSGEGPRKRAEDKARKEFPLFLALELRKVD